ncbi:hypothetical protein NQ318_015505 [Aromia moschata]|uniref:Cytochrome b-c1 complex subunit 2, mitochondrial n=1 Tax=Aromia moschata TaxID=1265417 RepID=A0AAV8XRF4_9CUCU|nr:hypothetical protein NQ318_015505 [Aromia moschata]
MASSIVKTPLIRIVSARGYSQLAPISGIQNYEIKSSVLSNKLVVAAGDNESAITRISIVFRSIHKNSSQFAITRNIQQVGANLTATSDRETIAYTLEGTRAAVEKALPFLTEVATQQVFKPWEVSDVSNRILLEIATRPLQLRAVDLLHNAAFRTGLGNSLFVPKSQIGKISSETLQHYVASNFLSGRAAVIGLGVSSGELTQYAQSLKINTGDGCLNPSPYKGGELRSNKGGDVAFVAVAGEGAGLKDSKEALAFAVLQRAVGIGPQIKYSTRDNGILTKTIGSAQEYAAAAINVSYFDSGLFGVLLALPSKCSRKVVESAVKLLTSSTVSDEDVTRGKNQLKAALLLDAESGANAIHNFGTQAVLLQCLQTRARSLGRRLYNYKRCQ